MLSWLIGEVLLDEYDVHYVRWGATSDDGRRC